MIRHLFVFSARVLLLIVTAAITGLPLLAICEVSAADEVQRPNILFIAVDDLRPSISCYGDTHAVTPHIARLATKTARDCCRGWRPRAAAHLGLSLHPHSFPDHFLTSVVCGQGQTTRFSIVLDCIEIDAGGLLELRHVSLV